MNDMAETKTFTVVAAYRDPSSIFCTTVEASTPVEAVSVAWLECVDGNAWDDTAKQEEEWSDTMVFTGSPEVVG